MGVPFGVSWREEESGCLRGFDVEMMEVVLLVRGEVEAAAAQNPHPLLPGKSLTFIQHFRA